MNLRDKIHDCIKSSLDAAISNGELPSAEFPMIKVEYPKEEKFGDYSTPLALESAKITRKSPMETGEILKKYIVNNPLIEKVEVVKPGFINIFISAGYMISEVEKITAEKENYGRIKKDNPLKINIEFVSANPTGPLNIVSARAGAAGDTIANLLECCGDIVHREFYVNDFGNQVNLLGKSVLERIKEIRGENFNFPEDGYHGEYIKDIAAFIIKTYPKEMDAIKNEDELIEFLSEKAVNYNVERQKSDLEYFNIKFYKWSREKDLHEKGEVIKTLDLFEKKNVIYEEDGKKLFRSTDFGDDKDRVVLRDDGRPTYLLADITYHREKISRGYDRIIDIWGPDHHGYIARLSGAMNVMGYGIDKFRVLIAQQVNLLVEGEAVKMSKRLGNFSTMRELVDEIGTDVARYFFTMRSLDSHLDFDLALAKRNSSENPVFYLQYAHARICSIFREAAVRGYSADFSNRSNEAIDSPEAYNLQKILIKFPEEILDAANTLEPHRITTYLMRLAQSFHRFYTEHRILSDDRETAAARLFLADAVRIVMKNGLGLLGVSAPEKM